MGKIKPEVGDWVVRINNDDGQEEFFKLNRLYEIIEKENTKAFLFKLVNGRDNRNGTDTLKVSSM